MDGCVCLVAVDCLSRTDRRMSASMHWTITHHGQTLLHAVFDPNMSPSLPCGWHIVSNLFSGDNTIVPCLQLTDSVVLQYTTPGVASGAGTVTHGGPTLTSHSGEESSPSVSYMQHIDLSKYHIQIP